MEINVYLENLLIYSASKLLQIWMMKQDDEWTTNINNHIVNVSTLQLSEDTGYVLYSAFGSFYIPSCIMVFVYINIYFAARSVKEAVIKNWWLWMFCCFEYYTKEETAKKTREEANFIGYRTNVCWIIGLLKSVGYWRSVFHVCYCLILSLS